METETRKMSESDLEQVINPLVQEANCLAHIKNNEEYIQANKFLTVIGSARKQVEAYWKPVVDKAFALHRELTGKRKQFTDKLDLAESATKTALRKYDDEQERLRKEEERKAQERARAEEDKQRKIKEEQEREWRRKEEAAREESERQQKAIQEADTEAARKAAEKAKEAADETAAKAAQKAEERAAAAAQVHVPTPIIPPSVPKVEGVKKVTRWFAVVVNKAQVPDIFKTIDQTALNKYAQSTKGEVPLAGVEFRSETTTERTGR